MKEHTDRELYDFIIQLKSGAVTLTADEEPQHIYAGNVYYLASNGWKVVVFNDCNVFDYFDTFISNDGRITNHNDIPIYISSYFRNITNEEMYRIFGIPGYLTHRDDQWIGYKHTPVKKLNRWFENLVVKFNAWRMKRMLRKLQELS